jgi:hypothetical protein
MRMSSSSTFGLTTKYQSHFLKRPKASKRKLHSLGFVSSRRPRAARWSAMRRAPARRWSGEVSSGGMSFVSASATTRSRSNGTGMWRFSGSRIGNGSPGLGSFGLVMRRSIQRSRR